MTDILIVGSGPAGLATAIAAKQHGLSHMILEKGSFADAIRRFPTNMVYFSTPELLEIGDVPFVCPTFRPTRADSLRYYQAVARKYQLDIRYDTRATGISGNAHSFEIRTNVATYTSRFVVVATGYFDGPNEFNVPGADLPKVHRSYTEPFPCFDREVAIIGGKNSAVDAALELYRNGAHVSLIHRGSKLSEGVKYWLLPDIENRIKSGEIKAYFESTAKEIRSNSVVLGGKHDIEISNDVVFVLIGYTPDTSMLKNAGVRIDPESLAPIHTPETLETNVNGLFVAGSIAAGKYNNRIFIENGRLHGEKIVQAILARK